MTTRILMALIVVTLASSCGWTDTDTSSAAEPSPRVDSPATGDESKSTDNNDSTSINTGNSDTQAPAEPVEDVVEEQPSEPVDSFEEGHYYSQPRQSRCDGNFARCDMQASTMPPATVGRLSYMMLAEPQTDCDDVDDYYGSGDGIACAFARLRAAINTPISDEDFDTSFAYELYQDGSDWRLDVFELDPAGRVRRSSLAGDTARSLWGFDDVTLDGNTVVARSGEVRVRTDYWNFPVELVVRDAAFHGTVVRQGDALVVESGELTGHLEVMDFFASLNQQASVCAGDVTEPFSSDSSVFAECPDYGNHPEPACQGFDFFCPFFSPFAIMADVDLNDDTIGDAFSVRLELDFAAAERRF